MLKTLQKSSKFIIFTLFLSLFLPNFAFSATKPIVNLDDNKSVLVNTEVCLSANQSYFPGNDRTNFNYKWEVTSYPFGYTGEMSLDGLDKPEFCFTPNVGGNYLTQLTLTSPEGASSSGFQVTQAYGFDEYFTDLPESYWARPYIFHLAYLGVLEGYPDRTMRAENPISRAEFTKLCFKALQKATGKTVDEYITEHNFDRYYFDSYYADVSQNDWFFDEIVLATNLNILEGYTDRTFRPHRTVSMAEALKIVFHFVDIDTTVNSTIVNLMKDVNPTDWYARYFSTAWTEGIYQGVDGYMKPNQAITRAQAASIIDQVFFNPLYKDNLTQVFQFAEPKDWGY